LGHLAETEKMGVMESMEKTVLQEKMEYQTPQVHPA